MRTQPDYVIRQLEIHNSRLDKEAILEAAMQESLDEFFDGVRMCLDKLVTFGVKEVPAKEEVWEDTEQGGRRLQPNGQGLKWEDFVEMAEMLRTRKLTGHAARDAIEMQMNVATTEQWNDFYRRILQKDLKCGVSEKTVNKVAKKMDRPEYAVPVFECMLAHDSANHERKVSGTKILEPKLDGVRCITVIDYEAREVKQYTRNGKLLENFTHITDALEKYLDEFGRSYVLDGEVMSNNFQELMRQVHRKRDVSAGDAVLHVFDMLPLVEFKTKVSVMGQRRRSNSLKTWNKIFEDTGCVEAVPWCEVDLDTMVGEEEFKDYNARAIEQGYEGIMIKDPEAPYECKRSTSWLKQKPFIEVSLEVTEVEEGTGRNAGRLGAVVCRGIDDGKEILVNCGSGFTDDDRTAYWDCRDSLVGQVVEIRADAVTQNQDGTYSLRFPRFLKFRGFKRGEKL
jgi:DNA ligase-1